jgi:hypothetical protein
VALDPKDAVFTFKAQKVKFLWMSLPSTPYFTVSYRLIPKNQATPAAPVLKGAFSFTEKEKTVSIPITERDVSLAALDAGEVKDLVAEVLTTPVPEPVIDIPVEETKTAMVEKPANTETVQTTPPPSPETVTVTKPVTKKPTPAKEPAADVQVSGPEAAQGVYYRIQLAAGHKPVNVERYFSKLKLDKEVRKETHDGWQKYSVGSFNLYKDARDYRIHIWNTTPVKDAFVTAYNNGQRITVQEALMETEQQWYQ